MRRPLLYLLVVLAAGTTVLAAQFPFFGDDVSVPVKNARYDGRFTFARVRYNSEVAQANYYYGLPPWAHGYISRGGGTRAEEGLMRIMNDLSFLNGHVDDSVVVGLDDPQLGRYPVLYMTEEGFWSVTNREAAAFRSYLQKGGFVIFDDFRMDGDSIPWGGGWENFADNMQHVLPGVKFVDLDTSHPIFHSFFEIDSFDIIKQPYGQGRPIFRGIFEDNDPSKRLMAVIDYNTDIANFWEFSQRGLYPVDDTNQGYKLGVNYIVYGLTH